MKPPIWAIVLRNPEDKPHVTALKALAEGRADENQQRIAFDFIIKRVCGVDETAWFDDAEGGERASSFASGRRYVGLQLRRWVDLPMEKLFGHRDGNSPGR